MNEKQLSKFFFLMLLAFLGIAGLTASQKSLHIVQSSNYEDEINQKEESEISYSESNAVLGIDGAMKLYLPKTSVKISPRMVWIVPEATVGGSDLMIYHPTDLKEMCL